MTTSECFDHYALPPHSRAQLSFYNFSAISVCNAYITNKRHKTVFSLASAGVLTEPELIQAVKNVLGYDWKNFEEH